MDFTAPSPYTVLVVVGGLFILTVVYQLWLWPLVFSPLKRVPGPSFGHPLWGQFPAIIKAEAGLLQREWVKEHGGKEGVVKAVGPLGIERVIFMTASALHKIMVSDWTEYPRPDFMRHTLGSVTGYGLLTVTGNEHKQMRRVMNPAFSIAALTAQTTMYWEHNTKLVEIMKESISKEENGVVMPMYEWCSKVTLDIICDTAFGYKTNSLVDPNNKLAHSYEEMIKLQSGTNLARFVAILSIPGAARLVQSDWMYNHREWLSKSAVLQPLRTILESMKTISEISQELLDEKIREAQVVDESDLASKRDIMSLLVRARARDTASDKFAGDYRMTDRSMMDQVLTFLGAGHETTASGLAWTLWLLAKDPECQTKLRAEVQPFISQNPEPEYRALKELSWLDCVVMESLRILPPVPMTFRKTKQSGYVEGVWVPKETILYIPIRVINSWQEIWGPDAEEWNPSRWLNLPETYNSTFSLMSFIAGPHACIGRTMAVIEMKAVLAYLIANFEFEPAYEGQIIHPTAAITMSEFSVLMNMIRN